MLKILKRIGPGFITGTADDGPSGVATYSQTGAKFGFSQLWLYLFTFPFMIVIQQMCGRIGMVTGKGLAGVIRTHYSKPVRLGSPITVTDLSVITTYSEVSALLSKYTGGRSVSDYAKTSAAICLKTGVVTGSSAATLSHNDSVTRATRRRYGGENVTKVGTHLKAKQKRPKSLDNQDF